MKITLEQALSIVSIGWNENTKELYTIADTLIKEEANRLHLIYQKKLIDKKLQQFKEK